MNQDSSINITNSSVSGNIVSNSVSGNVEANTYNENHFSGELLSLLSRIDQLDTSEFQPSSQAELEAHATALREEAANGAGRSVKSKTALSAIKSILSSTAGSTAASGIVAAVNQLLSQF